MSPKPSGRRGVTLVLLIAALMLLAIVSATLVRLAKLQSDRARHDLDRVQTAWLVEAGLERAWARLGRDPAYEGETWRIAADELGGRPGSVQITVRPDEDADVLRIEVRAQFPDAAIDTNRITKTFQARPPARRSGDSAP